MVSPCLWTPAATAAAGRVDRSAPSANRTDYAAQDAVTMADIRSRSPAGRRLPGGRFPSPTPALAHAQQDDGGLVEGEERQRLEQRARRVCAGQESPNDREPKRTWRRGQASLSVEAVVGARLSKQERQLPDRRARLAVALLRAGLGDSPHR